MKQIGQGTWKLGKCLVYEKREEKKTLEKKKTLEVNSTHRTTSRQLRGFALVAAKSDKKLKKNYMVQPGIEPLKLLHLDCESSALPLSY